MPEILSTFVEPSELLPVIAENMSLGSVLALVDIDPVIDKSSLSVPVPCSHLLCS